eukprot:7978875-Prorocentrum_lima.AAC.1
MLRAPIVLQAYLWRQPWISLTPAPLPAQYIGHQAQTRLVQRSGKGGPAAPSALWRPATCDVPCRSKRHQWH